MPELDSGRVALQYSGGTDSTLAACHAAENFDQVHLVTYRRFGMVNVANSEVHVGKLREVYGPGHIARPPISNIDALFRHVSYDRYLRDLARHRFAVLTTCGLCKLAMHLRTLVYCVDNDVGNVWDGANRNMTIFPAQMPEIIPMVRDMFARAGVAYGNPVYDYDDSQGINFGSALWGLSPAREASREAAGRTTGTELYERGILPEPDVKGTPYDKKIQGRCYQFVLFNLWARWYHLERRGMDDYRERVTAYYTAKIARCNELVDEFLADPQGSRLRRLCEASR